jgi:hypothetical protein
MGESGASSHFLNLADLDWRAGDRERPRARTHQAPYPRGPFTRLRATTRPVCLAAVVTLTLLASLAGCVNPRTGAPASPDGPETPRDGSAPRAIDAPAVDLAPVPDGGRAAGEACAGSGECRSGVCADGVCCTAACADLCHACNVSGSEGNCTAVPMSKPPARAGECEINPSNRCGNTGSCDGAGKCQLTDAATTCGARSCDPATGILTAEPRCDGKGSCQAAEPGISCAPARCNAAHSGCASPCGSSDDCLPPNQCLAGSCGKSDVALPCSTGDQCKSNLCVDGVCCDRACTGQCEACDVSGSIGTCKPATGIPHHGAQPSRPGCGGDAACPGSCNGSDAARCVYPANRCRSRSCSAVAQEVINEATCDASGVCPAISTMACAHVCRAGTCTACTPSTRQCAGDVSQLCDNNGAWQNQACPSSGNMLPACNSDGTCGLRCEPVMGVRPASIACGNTTVCPAWNFESVTPEGWSVVTAPSGSGALNVVSNNLGDNNSNMLAIAVHFTAAVAAQSTLTIQLALCPSPGISLTSRPFVYRVWMDGSGGSFSVYPIAFNATGSDTPNGLSGNSGSWILDQEGFFLNPIERIQIVVIAREDWTGTVFFDDIGFR